MVKSINKFSIMKKLFPFAAFIWVIALGFQCESKKGEVDIYEGMDGRTKIRMRQYMVQGKILYQMHCQNCHGEDGLGLGKLIPPLAKSDYLISDIARGMCIIKNGQEGKIQVNGIEYEQLMPPLNNITPLEIAEIITFVSNSWGNKTQLWDVKEAERVLSDCQLK
jgi:cytochrome c551